METARSRSWTWIGWLVAPAALAILLAFLLSDSSDPTPSTVLDPTAPVTTAVSTPEAVSPSSSGVPQPLGEEEASELLALMSAQAFRGDPLTSVATAVEALDERFIAPLIELMRAMEIGLVSGDQYADIINALQALAGDESIILWPDWVRWYSGTDLEPPPGFQDWKGALLSVIDQDFLQFFEGQPAAIRVEEIVWGGVALDGIPALDQPAHIEAANADYLTPRDLVFGVSINGDTRAYPLRILDWHEMVNDTVGGVPVSLAYCTLCGAGVLYRGDVGEEVLTFGSSGFLMRSNKLMYDRNTFTLWNQLTGEPAMGPLVGSGITLERIPVVVTAWEDWLALHPDTKVLDPETGFRRHYESGSAYGSYFASEGTMFPVALRGSLLPEKERVFSLLVDGDPAAYPTLIVTEEMVVNDSVGGTNVVVIATGGDLIGAGTDGRTGRDVVWDAGAEVRAYERGDFEFAIDEAGLIDQDGAFWTITEDALVSADGTELPRLPGHLSYWFGWFSYFPNTQVYGVEG